jgi:hypothetical protein
MLQLPDFFTSPLIVLCFVNFAECEVITPVNNDNKLVGFKHEEWNAPWWKVGLQGFGG